MALVSRIFALHVLATTAIGALHAADSDCGRANSPRSGGIVGGWIFKHHQYPWLTILAARVNRTMYTCGSSLITNQHVLTVAHCAPQRSTITAYLGVSKFSEVRHSKKAIVRTVVRVFISMFNANPAEGRNDIAVLALDRVVPFGATVRPVCLPTPGGDSDGENLVGRSLLVAGWGDTYPQVRSVDEGKAVYVEVRPMSECEHAFGAMKNHAKRLCIGHPGKSDGPCIGDSGGPAMVVDKSGRHTVVGLVSFGHSRCLFDPPAVLTKVAPFVNLIQTAIRQKI